MSATERGATGGSESIDINRDYCAAETALLPLLIRQLAIPPEQYQAIEAQARVLAQCVQAEARAQRGPVALLHKFPLSSQEGLALMQLAEALLRIPEPATARHFLLEKLQEGDWLTCLVAGDPLLTRAALRGLHWASRWSTSAQPLQPGLAALALARGLLPVFRQAINQLAGHFVLGKNIAAAMRRAKKHEARGYRYSYDMLGESARTQADAERYFQRYLNAIDALKYQAQGNHPVTRAGISVKLSALHPRYHPLHRERLRQELVPRLRQLALAAKYADINLTLDAENAYLLDISLECFARVYRDPVFSGWDGFGLAVQAYQKRAPAVIDWLVALSQEHQRRIMVRLVKGAYWDTEIKQAQVQGHDDYPVYTQKAATDIAYLACAQKLLQHPKAIFSQFATHNAHTVAAVIAMAGNTPFEFQRLQGMGQALYDTLIDDYPCRTYAPVGEYPDLLAYLVRRLLENGANSSFVNHVARADSLASLVRDPVSGWRAGPVAGLPVPGQLYPDRPNSRGLNLADPGQCAALLARLRAFKTNQVQRGTHLLAPGVVQRNPANKTHILGAVQHDDAQALAQALARAERAQAAWAARSTAERAACLEQLAQLLERQRDELIALCVYEAGKTLEDSVAEVREAIDFCHYYAAQARRQDVGRPLGVVLCISPWNFPLAILIGQLSAAAVMGNCVLAKAAEQTGLLARRVAELLLAAGFPPHVVQVLVCAGTLAGEVLLPDTRVAAVVFTGSTDSAHRIQRALAQRPDAPVPLIAETGGQNAMIVDATALPEQVVDDVLQSAFYSAGQRCSALRILCVQEELADTLLPMLIGAMAQLRVGNPEHPDTDIGPVIDARALGRLQDHLDYLDNSREAHRLFVGNPVEQGERGWFFRPVLYQIDRLGVLRGEVFGPVLHVLRYPQGGELALLDALHATGYGLTLGIHSRRSRWASALAARARVGNIYINRNMVGAVVGVQPFGGMGLSGTGPKAGGPAYLRALQHLPERAPEAGSRCLMDSGETLPGPTGEINRLYRVPRGAVLCIAGAEPAAIEPFLIACAQLGNALTLAARPAEVVGYQLLLDSIWARYGPLAAAGIPAPQLVAVDTLEANARLQALVGNRAFAALCAPADHPLRTWLCRQLAEREGPLCPLLINAQRARTDLQVEKTLTINTTAIGGNAQLLSQP